MAREGRELTLVSGCVVEDAAGAGSWVVASFPEGKVVLFRAVVSEREMSVVGVVGRRVDMLVEVFMMGNERLEIVCCVVVVRWR
jgi:hypothetical protein